MAVASSLASGDALVLQGVTRTFGALRAIENVSLSVAAVTTSEYFINAQKPPQASLCATGHSLRRRIMRCVQRSALLGSRCCDATFTCSWPNTPPLTTGHELNSCAAA